MEQKDSRPAIVSGHREKHNPKLAMALLIIIFLAILSLRLYLSFTTRGFSDDRSYFVLRQVESITSTGLPLYDDPLSYGGRTNIFMPLFYYILAFFSMFIPADIVMKIIPNILLSSLVFITYLISYKIKKDELVSLATAVVANFVPVFFSETINQVSAYSLSIPLVFLSLYLFMDIDKGKNAVLYTISVIALSLTSPIIFVLLIAFLIYMLIFRLQEMKNSKKETELILFTIFFSIWVCFLFYKKAFLFHGPNFIWQNIPLGMLQNYFSNVNVLEMIYKIGAATLIAGIFITYNNLMKEKNKEINLSIAFIIASALLLWFKLIELNTGMILLGISLSFLFGYFWVFFFNYLEKTRMHSWKPLFAVIMFAIIIPLALVPSMTYTDQVMKNAPKQSLLKSLDWVSKNTPDNSTVISWINDGNKITYFAKRKNVLDSNFFLINDANERFDNVEKVYTTVSEVEAIKLMNRYGADYILLNPYAMNYYNIDSLKYADDEKCFEKVYDDFIKIYRLKCVV